MNPIIAIDFNGALLKSRPFDVSHSEWFKVFSILLKDDSILNLEFKENMFDGIYKVMDRYLGNIDKESKRIFARTIYGMILISEVTSADLVEEFANYLRTLKDRYTLVLITTVPKLCVESMLQKLNCRDIFDIVYSSELKNYPDKKALFDEFITFHPKPLVYIGFGDATLGYLSVTGIKTISVSWISEGKFKGDSNISTVVELKSLL
jgi:FMN phosphatase YigB (HAD superfamily)